MRPVPETGFLRQWDILGDTKANPPIAPLIPVSKSTWWSWIATGKAPRPVKLGPNTTAWRVSDIREFITSHDEGRAS